jgi:hypothetical protein
MKIMFKNLNHEASSEASKLHWLEIFDSWFFFSS